MLIESNTYRAMFKYWSPMSTGAWALLVFGLFSFLSFVAAVAEDDRVRSPALRTAAARWPGLRTMRAPSRLGIAISVIGSLFGLYLAWYTGSLVAVTNRPIWFDTTLFGRPFAFSGSS